MSPTACCRHCGLSFPARESDRGWIVHCPHCDYAVAVPPPPRAPVARRWWQFWKRS